MAAIKQINEFLEAGPFALVGVSRNPKKFGYTAFRELIEKGMDIVPVNPYANEILNIKAYNSVKELPSEVRAIILMTKKSQTASVVREAKEKGIKQIWIQQMADSRDSLQELEGTDINFISGECILMHYRPSGIHKFHMKLRKFFRTYPK
jgi:uncharacterized protein